MDFIEKAILIGLGLEEKMKDLVVELEEKGKEKRGEKEEGIPAHKRLENKLVEDATKAIRELLSVLKGGRERIEKELGSTGESLIKKLGLATKDDVDAVKEMARVAREKVDKLEKRLNELGKDKKAK